MMFRSKLATLLASLVLAGSALAGTQNKLVCPGIHALQAEGLHTAAEILNDFYLTYNTSNYNTDAQWIFMVAPVNADTEETALEEGNKILSTLSGNPSVEDVGDNTWACEYQLASQNMVAVAIHADNMLSPLSMSRYVRKHP